jgi:hypothetical protein
MKKLFDPTTPRSIAGKDFQERVLGEMLEYNIFAGAQDFREMKRAEGIAAGNPYTEKDLSFLEKEFGDIIVNINGQDVFVECCFAMGETHTSMCETKRQRFIGPNKWYCFGKRIDPDTRIFIPSAVWQMYMGRIDLNYGKGWRYRRVPLHLIGTNIRAAVVGLDNFAKIMEDG